MQPVRQVGGARTSRQLAVSPREPGATSRAPASVSRAAALQIGSLLTALLDKRVQRYTESLHVLLASGFERFDNACMALLLKLLQKYPNISSVNLGELVHPQLDWSVFIAFLKHQALGGGVVAVFIDETVDRAGLLRRGAKDAIKAHRKACEDAVEFLLPELPGGVGYDKKAQKEAALLIPWRAPKLYATKAAHAGTSENDNVWWGYPFWYPKTGWAKLGIE